MSVAVPVIDHVDPDLRRIYLKAGVREIHMLDDIYYEMRNLRRVNESLRGWYSFCEAGGNVQKTANTYTPRYLTMITDPRPITTKVVPAGDPSTPDVAHTLVVKGEVITDQGTSNAAAFDKSSLVVSVDLEFEPPGAEIIRIDDARITDIKAKTDQMVFTNPNELDVNVKSQNDATVHGTGIVSDKWRGTP